eukprot:TRINITY_DN25205_c0_g1_i2.p1 TRINITY_DN25205_c0_g1~~TRINITY_DN25205_c0_g1_i2.p1  ORF type:complete len:721 (+),score=172.82 TRINITY_DN25205_c0_g1_i2:163-2325(+)
MCIRDSLDDHLVCQGGNDPDTWGAYKPESTVPWPGTPSTQGLPYFVRAKFTHRSNEATSPTFSLLYTAGDTAIAAPVPASAFSEELQPAQMTRLAMSDRLTHGIWNTWAKQSVTAHILLPAGVMLKIGLCDLNTRSCKEDGEKGDIDSGVVRLGPHALDHSYTQLYFSQAAANVSIETSQRDGDFFMVVTPAAGFNASQFAVVVIALFTDQNVPGASWGLPGAVSASVEGNGSISAVADGDGIKAVNMYGTQPVSTAPINVGGNNPVYLSWVLSADGVVVSTGGKRSRDQIVKTVSDAKAAELARYAAYGEVGEAKEASQAGMMWNLQWSPGIPGTFAPVSRGWGRPWVIFDWDNIFGAYQLSLDAKELGYSQLAAVIKTKTAEGMVPNYWQPQGISYDRTEPIIGSKVLSAMYAKYGDKWIVELLFGDLFDWTQWFMRNREQADLICLGSNPNLPSDPGANTMQAARYESGLDNSPMYDGEFYNTSSHRMMLYDVGMSSMVAMELQALANLSLTAFDPPRTKEHAILTGQLERLSSAISTELWDDQSGIFANKFSNGSGFYRRFSPTSFYPMQAGIATPSQAETMVVNWLLRPDRFCVSPQGDFKGNSDDCYWGLPSIQASDPAYPPLGYWRGYVWGPMIQLTYWALSNPEYQSVPVVAQGRKALAKQATAMMLNQWRLHRHVCENYNPHRNGTDCTGDKFYHWGGLAGFVSILEEGYY